MSSAKLMVGLGAVSYTHLPACADPIGYQRVKHHADAQTAKAYAEPLGQPEWNDRTRLCRLHTLGLEALTGIHPVSYTHLGTSTF